MGDKPMAPGSAQMAEDNGAFGRHAPEVPPPYPDEQDTPESLDALRESGLVADAAPRLSLAKEAALALGQRLVLLARTVETEVVPRLVLVHRASPPQARPRVQPITASDVSALTASILANDREAAVARIEEARARGATLEHIGLDLMAPVARRLGELWEEDHCTYTDVTLGVWRLQGLLRALNPVFQPQSDPARGEARRALIVAIPGEDHTFGTDIVAGLLRLSGWEICNEPAATAAELARRVQRDRFAIVGLSAGCSGDLGSMATLITKLRRAAGGQAIGVMVGGYIFNQNPEGALRVGADAVALDARHAARQAESLIGFLGTGN
ncbi:cobalamin-binding protein [Roseomonas nepalensis]|uniref:Cobalamin-binding protein n=1 Tax=Muricoccus nepalensis TaxID=1854500 RepID=A0A502GCW7_9PROT|nr:cobalamin-dependent protein [Roseomonas nepalensis]TPG58553.1 cobalamin-binding protein [Roseomonas nepalensis]